MRPFRPRSCVPALLIVLLSLSLSSGCTPPGQPARDEAAAPRVEGQRLARTTPQAEDPEGKTLSASLPAGDARGEALPGLPRPPGSVRVGYSEREADGLVLVRTAYMTREGADAVRGFYRSVFRAEGWQVANVDYSGGGWRFLVLRGSREAGVEMLPREGGSEVKIELSGPAFEAQESGSSAGGSKR